MQLTNITLEAYEDGKKGMSRMLDTDLLELLTKRFKTNKKYSGRALKSWNKLVELSELPVNKRSKKYQVPKMKYYKSLNELCRHLKVLMTSKDTGNESTALDNEIVEIIDRLLKDGLITEEDYRKIHDYVE